MSALPAFSRLITDAMTRRGLGLRELCRRAKLDPSFLSKVLAGKRNPPSEEEVLRRLAEALETDPVELLVAAGRIPSEWSAMLADPGALRRVSALLGSVPRAGFRAPAPAVRAAQTPARPKSFSEELL
jgi:transcriptional regulator with XRE-family HTH domain